MSGLVPALHSAARSASRPSLAVLSETGRHSAESPCKAARKIRTLTMDYCRPGFYFGNSRLCWCRVYRALGGRLDCTGCRSRGEVKKELRISLTRFLTEVTSSCLPAVLLYQPTASHLQTSITHRRNLPKLAADAFRAIPSPTGVSSM